MATPEATPAGDNQPKSAALSQAPSSVAVSESALGACLVDISRTLEAQVRLCCALLELGALGAAEPCGLGAGPGPSRASVVEASAARLATAVKGFGADARAICGHASAGDGNLGVAQTSTQGSAASALRWPARGGAQSDASVEVSQGFSSRYEQDATWEHCSSPIKARKPPTAIIVPFEEADESPRGRVEDLDPLDCWQPHGSGTSPAWDAFTSELMGSTKMMSSHETIAESMLSSPLRVSTCYARPGGWRQNIWDALALVIISYDLVTLPLLAFGFDDLTMRLATTSFWTLDIAMSFLQGFEKGGNDVMSPYEIARRYARTWLVPDVTIVMLDWVLIAVEADTFAFSGSDAASFFKSLRVLKLFRLLRVVRFLRFTSLVDTLRERIFDEHINAIADIMQMLVYLALFCHFSGCAWYAVGTMDDDLRGSWVAELEQQKASNVHRYAASFQWAFAQFAPCSSPYFAVNMREQFFNIFLLIGGFVLFSSCVGSVTSALTLARNRAAFNAKQISVLKRFFRDHRISNGLAHRIQSFVKETKRRRMIVTEPDVTLLQNLPDSLSKTVRMEVFGPILLGEHVAGERPRPFFLGADDKPHPFFSCLSRYYASALKSICFLACRHELLVKNTDIYHYGARAKHMLFMIAGRCEYLNRDKEPVTFEGYQYFCEAALYVKFRHRSRLLTLGDTTLLQVDASKFHAAVHASDAFEPVSTYARTLLEHVKREHFSVDLSLWHNKQQWDSIKDLVMEVFPSLEAVRENLRPSLPPGGGSPLHLLDGLGRRVGTFARQASGLGGPAEAPVGGRNSRCS